MPKCRFNTAEIRGIVAAVPPVEKFIDDEIALFGGNVKQIARIKKTIGLNCRRVVQDGVTSADLCEYAASELINKAEIDIESIDAIIFVTQTPDYFQPCNAAVLHGRLGGSPNCGAFDVNLGCSGYVYGLWLSHMMIESGGCDRIMLLAGDTMSRMVHPKDRSVAPLFGDGGSATLIEKSDLSKKSYFSLSTDGRGYDKLIVPGGAFRNPASQATREEHVDKDGNIRSAENLFMDGAEIFNFSIKVEPNEIRDLISYAGIELDEINYFVFHQANRYILKNIIKRMKLDPARVPIATVEKYGNQSSASIPTAICGELSEQISKEDTSKIFLSGFGVGLSWASAILGLSKLPVCEIVEFPMRA